MLPIAGHLAVDATRRHVESAMPDAPVVTEEPRTPAGPGRSRQTLARTLRRLADRLEPPRCADHALRPHPR